MAVNACRSSNEPTLVATKTGVELNALEPHEVKAGAVL